MGRHRKVNTKAGKSVAELSTELQALQRQRAVILKSRNMAASRLQAIVAGYLGYHSSMAEGERTAKFDEARGVIKNVVQGTPFAKGVDDIIKATMVGVDSFNNLKDNLEKEMLEAVKLLPVAEWAQERDQRGFGLLILAVIVGESGDLSNYPYPICLFKRFGCNPWVFNNEAWMGATWRSGRHGALPASEWERFGYSPRRRSIAYLVGEGLLKLNFQKDKESGEVIWTGPYRHEYERARAKYDHLHPPGEDKRFTPKRSQLHGMLMATRLLLKRLWAKWNGRPMVDPPFVPR